MKWCSLGWFLAGNRLTCSRPAAASSWEVRIQTEKAQVNFNLKYFEFFLVPTVTFKLHFILGRFLFSLLTSLQFLMCGT